MRRALLTTLLLCLLAQSGNGQLTRLITRPEIPRAETLGRLGLTLGWTTRVPMESLRDNFTSIQLLPTTSGHELLVQTRSGLVQLLDAETGDLKWRTTVGQPYRLQHLAAANDKSIFVTREQTLFALDRETGRHQLYAVDAKTRGVSLGFPLLRIPSAPPVADVAAIFICSDDSVTAYLMPQLEKLKLTLPSVNPEAALPTGEELVSSFQPNFMWNVKLPDVDIQQVPLLYQDQLTVVGANGHIVALGKYNANVRYRFRAFGNIPVLSGQYENTAYIGSEDHIVYALDMRTQAVEWRYFASGPVSGPVPATDADVIVLAERVGLSRIGRKSGEMVWRNTEAVYMLSVNERYVYALDSQRNLLVLDYLNGRTLAKADFRDYTRLLRNFETDRIYLGADDGRLICLHHRSHPTPLRLRNPPPPPAKDGTNAAPGPMGASEAPLPGL